MVGEAEGGGLVDVGACVGLEDAGAGVADVDAELGMLGAPVLRPALVACLLEHAVSATPAIDATTNARVVKECFTPHWTPQPALRVHGST